MEPLHIYLAGSWNRREELQGYALQLEEAGHVATSHWLKPNAYEDRDDDLTLEEMREISRQNITDVAMSHAVVLFTEPDGSENTRGGRHIEYGLTLGMSGFLDTPKDVAIIGPREGLFYSLVADEGVFESFDQFLKFLEEAYGDPRREIVVPGGEPQGDE